MLHVLELGHDRTNDEMRYSVMREDRGVFEVRISLSAKAQAQPSLPDRIIDWYRRHALPDAESSIRIPDYHFDPSYR